MWDRVASVQGVNDELAPWVRMTVPKTWDGRLAPGSLGRSWILLGGVVPIDYDDIRLAVLEPGRGFRERSAMASAREWWHDRELVGLPGGGTRVVDEVRFVPRAGALGGLMAFVFEAMFRWRHRRLRRRFGET